MLYPLRLHVDAYHVPTATWHCCERNHGVRAVSRKHALDKGLRVIYTMPAYADRVNHEDWTVDASAEFRTEDI